MQLAPNLDARVSDPGHEYQLDVGNCVATGKLETAPNSAIMFRLCKSQEWAGRLQWNEFEDRVMAVNPPIRLDCEKATGLTKPDVHRVKVWFEVVADTVVPTETMWDSLEVAAKTCPVHPVRDYLLGLPAGDPTIFNGLASRWFGTPLGSVLDDELLKRFLVAAVRRILEPGTQVDTMLILYSAGQGRKKTQWVRTMFGHDWSSQQMPDMTTKDASQQIATVWGQEIGELDRLLKLDQTTAKDFISRCVDRYRPAYGRAIVCKPRQCVFVGTTNQLEFLRDPTGERRYWPITVEVLRIDLEMVKAMRDQVWAAAVALALDPYFEHWIDEGSPLDAELKLRQTVHSEEDSWLAAVTDFCAGRECVTGEEVFHHVVMKGAPEYLEKWDRRAQNKVGDVLRRLGAWKDSKRYQGQVRKVFVFPDNIRRLAPSLNEQKRRKAAESVANATQPKNVQGGGG
jgi:predicted P-loop ATPase